jgi:hypothetical protein
LAGPFTKKEGVVLVEHPSSNGEQQDEELKHGAGWVPRECFVVVSFSKMCCKLFF